MATGIKQWEHHGVASLDDKPRSGRPPKLTLEEKDLAQQSIKEDPRCLQHVVERLRQKTAKRLSIAALKRLANKARLRWQRVRKSVKSLREPAEFRKCPHARASLQKQEDQGKLDWSYFDESGFTLDPSIPYAWQESGTVIEIPATKGTRINVRGLRKRQNDLSPSMFAQSINTSGVVACVNDVCTHITKKTIVVMENSARHRREEFEDYSPLWKKKGLMIKY